MDVAVRDACDHGSRVAMARLRPPLVAQLAVDLRDGQGATRAAPAGQSAAQGKMLTCEE